jgi:PKD-like domain
MRIRQLPPRLLLVALFTVFTGAAEFSEAQPLVENFDSVAGLGAAGWVMTNNSSPAGSTGWFQGNTAAFTSQGGASNSYVASNLNAAAFGGNISNWLISPALTNLENGVVLTFYTRTETAAPAADRLEVRLSTNGPSSNVGATDASVGDFTTLLLAVNPTLAAGGYPSAWTLFTVTLSGLPPGPLTGRIAFRHFVSDTSTAGDTIGLDTLNIAPFTCPPPPPLVMNAPSIVGAGSPNRVASVALIGGAVYAWTITNGTITSGQGTNQITFTAGVAGTTLVLNVSLTLGACPFGGGFANVTVAPIGSAVQFYGLAPCRLIDTRNAPGPLGAPALAPAGSLDRSFTITGVCGIPSDARAVSLNVTVTNVTASGSLLLYRGDGAATLASTINFRPGITRANNTHTQLAIDGSGTFRVQNGSAGTLDFIVDVNGYYR